VSGLPHPPRLRAHPAQGCALAAFLFYLGWNLHWILKKKIPPSILQSFTGIPCPTTGCTRAVLAALHGEWRSAFLWNPLTSIYLGLLLFSALWLGGQLAQRKRLALPSWAAWSWVAALLLGWVCKFLLGATYW
jgi:hypothetical protein